MSEPAEESALLDRLVELVHSQPTKAFSVCGYWIPKADKMHLSVEIHEGTRGTPVFGSTWEEVYWKLAERLEAKATKE